MTTTPARTDLPLWPAPLAGGPLDATVEIPGSKSLTNRLLVLAALADGPGVLRGALRSRDADLMIAALRSLGATITEGDAPGTLHVTPGPVTGGVEIDCGLAGTVMRFLPPVAALADGAVRFDGDPQARVRPMLPVLAALHALGVTVSSDGPSCPRTCRSPCTAVVTSPAAPSTSTRPARRSSCPRCCWPPPGSTGLSCCATSAPPCRACRTSR